MPAGSVSEGPCPLGQRCLCEPVATGGCGRSGWGGFCNGTFAPRLRSRASVPREKAQAWVSQLLGGRLCRRSRRSWASPSTLLDARAAACRLREGCSTKRCPKLRKEQGDPGASPEHHLHSGAAPRCEGGGGPGSAAGWGARPHTGFRCPSIPWDRRGGAWGSGSPCSRFLGFVLLCSTLCPSLLSKTGASAAPKRELPSRFHAQCLRGKMLQAPSQLCCCRGGVWARGELGCVPLGADGGPQEEAAHGGTGVGFSEPFPAIPVTRSDKPRWGWSCGRLLLCSLGTGGVSPSRRMDRKDQPGPGNSQLDSSWWCAVGRDAAGPAGPRPGLPGAPPSGDAAGRRGTAVGVRGSQGSASAVGQGAGPKAAAGSLEGASWGQSAPAAPLACPGEVGALRAGGLRCLPRGWGLFPPGCPVPVAVPPGWALCRGRVRGGALPGPLPLVPRALPGKAGRCRALRCGASPAAAGARLPCSIPAAPVT